MRLVGLLILLTLPTFVLSQAKVDVPYGMSNEQNTEWIAKVRGADKKLQLSFIKVRLVQNRHPLNATDRLAVPLFVINGIPIEEDITERRREFLKTQLTAEIVEITVLEKEPVGLYINRRFIGIVLIIITDKKTSRKFSRLK